MERSSEAIHSLCIQKEKSGLIRFCEKRESFIWVNPEAILFIRSADHYVRTLLLHDNLKIWAIRHSTLKDLLTVLPGDHFIRLNKFYVVNRMYVSHINESAKTIFLRDGYPLFCEHRISPFILSMFRQP